MDDMHEFDIKSLVHDHAVCKSVADHLRWIASTARRESLGVNTTAAKRELLSTAEMIEGVLLHDTCECGAALLKDQLAGMNEADHDYADNIPVAAPITTQVRKLNPTVWGDLDPAAGEGEI